MIALFMQYFPQCTCYSTLVYLRLPECIPILIAFVQIYISPVSTLTVLLFSALMHMQVINTLTVYFHYENSSLIQKSPENGRQILQPLLVFVATTQSSVRVESDPDDQFHCHQTEKIYPIYKKLETILTNDTEAFYTMKQAFFPTLQPHFWESTRVNAVITRVCVITDETMMK